MKAKILTSSVGNSGRFYRTCSVSFYVVWARHSLGSFKPTIELYIRFGFCSWSKKSQQVEYGATS